MEEVAEMMMEVHIRKRQRIYSLHSRSRKSAGITLGCTWRLYSFWKKTHVHTDRLPLTSVWHCNTSLQEEVTDFSMKKMWKSVRLQCLYEWRRRRVMRMLSLLAKTPPVAASASLLPGGTVVGEFGGRQQGWRGVTTAMTWHERERESCVSVADAFNGNTSYNRTVNQCQYLF